MGSKRARRGGGTALATLVAAGIVACGGCGGAAPAKAPPSGWTPGLEQLIPEGVDLVARIDWKRAREAQVDGLTLDALRASGLSPEVGACVRGCLERAKQVRIAVRMGPKGLDGDVMVVVTGLAPAGKAEEIPCGAVGWEHTGDRGNLEVFEPRAPSSDRSAAALMIRSDRGAVAVVTPGQIDALLRVLRDGPDENRLEPGGDGFVALEGRVRDAQIPVRWKAEAPTLAASAQGLERFRLWVQVRGREIEVRAALIYLTEAAAAEAGEKLREVREALVGAGSPVYESVGKSMHASLQGDLLRVELRIPSAPSSPQDSTPAP